MLCSGRFLRHRSTDGAWALAVYLSTATFILGCGCDATRVRASLFSYFLNLLFSYRFSVPAAPTSALIQLRFIYAAPTLPGTCQFDPCVVLQQRLAEAAEMGNIYRAVRWGRALFLLHSHPSRQSRLQHPQRRMGAAVLVRTDAATIHAK